MRINIILEICFRVPSAWFSKTCPD